MQAAKGAGYNQWAKIYNLKQMSAALQYLQENGLLSYEELEAKPDRSLSQYKTASTVASFWLNMRATRSEIQEVLTVKANIDALLGTPPQEKNKEQER